MIKIFHTSDWHIDQLSKWISKKSNNLESLSTFAEYHLEKIKEMVDESIKEKVDFFVFAGDLFSDAVSNFKEKEIIINELLKYINILKNHNIHTVFLSWNHDIIYKRLSSNKNSLSLLSDVDYWEYLFVNNPESTEIQYKDYIINWEEIRILLFPYLKGEIKKQDIKEEIQKIAKEKKTVLIWHIDIFGALYNWMEIQFSNLDYVNVWTPEELEELWTIWNFLWHVHNHQVLGKKKITSYCGSPFRLSFNEEKSEKWYYIHEIKERILKSQFKVLENKIWKTIEHDVYWKYNEAIIRLKNITNEMVKWKEEINSEKEDIMIMTKEVEKKITKNFLLDEVKELLKWETSWKEISLESLEDIISKLEIENWKLSFVNLLEQLKDSEIKDWIVRIVLSNIRTEDYKYIPYKEITDILTDKEIFLNRGISYKNISSASIGESVNDLEFKNIEDSLNPMEILKKIIKDEKKDKDYKKEIVEELNNIINEINS